MNTPKKYLGLSSAERSEIQILKNKGYSLRKIAEVLGRSPNTISREIKVNSVAGEYIATKAKAKARVSLRSRRYQWQKIEHNKGLREFIAEKLAPPHSWSPKVIAGHLKHHQSALAYVSAPQIYAWLRSSHGQAYCPYLLCERYRVKKQRKNKTGRAMIPDRTSITERPVAALDRAEPGHCEYDSVVSSRHSGSTYALAVVQERSSRLVRAKLVPNLRPAPYAKTILGLVEGLQTRSLTTDNGIENKHHREIAKKTGTPVFFTDPYSSWQKGGVEHANKMLRRYFPKGTNFANITQDEVDAALWTINNKPRQSLGYKS
ncbi:MAG: IS30 family transposase, partial [Patescibacteria group bacterium]